MKCSQVMSEEPVYCFPFDFIAKVARLMKQEGVSLIPIIDAAESKKLVGIVSDRDLVLKVLAEERDPATIKVEEVMVHETITCRPDDDLQKALDVMRQNQLRRVPIVDEENRIVGIIA